MIGSNMDEADYDILFLFGSILLVIGVLFGWMWYNHEYNVKPAMERRRLAELEAQQKFVNDCKAQGYTPGWRSYQKRSGKHRQLFTYWYQVCEKPIEITIIVQ